MPNDNDVWTNALGQSIIGGAAGTAANSAIGAGLGLMLEKHNDQRQINQQTKLQNLSIKGSKEMTDYQYMKQLQMWKDTNYSAQMEQMNKAGVNPALLYGMSGGGATTTGGDAAHVGEGRAEQNPGEIQSIMGMGLMNQSAMNQAQIELMRAQARNLDADTANKPIQGTTTQKQGEMYDSQGKLNLANTGKAEADTELTKVVTDQEKVKLTIMNSTIEDAISAAKLANEEADKRIEALANKNYLDEKTAMTKIKQVQWDLIKTISEKALIDATKGKTDQETELLKKDNEKYFDKLASMMGLQSRMGIAAMTGAGAQQSQANTAMDAQTLQQWLHDMPDSEKAIFDILEKAAQAIILKGALTPTPNRTPIGYK